VPQQIALPPSFRVLAELAHCEGVATGPDGVLWTGDESGQIFRVDPGDGSHEQVANVGGWALGLALDAASRVYVCDYTAGRIVGVDPASGACETYADGVDGANWCVFDAAGGLYVSCSGSDERADGRVVRIGSGGSPVEALDLPPLFFPNGMAIATDGTLFIAESYGMPRIRAWREGETWVHCELPGTVPDGLTLTADGGILVTVFQPNQVLYVPPGGGEPEIFLEDWTGARLLTPTNAAFFGPELASLAVASLCGWSLAALETPWRGQRLFYPEVA
jgi:sugar lactone lactonase YvrE